MRIITPPTVGAVAQGPATQRADRPRAAFELPGGKAEAPSTAAARPTVAAAGLETLLAVQGMQPEDRREKRRRAMQRGRQSLDLLDDLKLSLLAGEPMPAVLLKLRSVTATALEGSGDQGSTTCWRRSTCAPRSRSPSVRQQAAGGNRCCCQAAEIQTIPAFWHGSCLSWRQGAGSMTAR